MYKLRKTALVVLHKAAVTNHIIIILYMYTSSLVYDGWSPGHPQSFQNVINYFKEHVSLNKVIVYKVD